MAGKYRDLTGEAFGRLTVTGKAPNIKNRSAFYCKCSCGKIDIQILAQSLKRNLTQSCGCLHAELTSKDLTGQQFGLWKALNPIEKRSNNGYRYWNCLCLGCGKLWDVSGESLLQSRSYSCIKCAGLARSKQFCIRGHDTLIWGRTSSQACRACIKDKHLRTHYGISLEEFIELFKAQDGKCAICGKDLGSYLPREPGFGKGCRIEVDHDHKLSKRESVRGLLCGGRWAGCNRKIGRIDNIEWLKNVINYLENPPAVKYLNITKG